MGRGKPFSQSLNRLVSADIVRRPVWMSSVEANRPAFNPVAITRPPRIVYPEDRLRNTYLIRNPEARRIPVNLKAKTVAERHIADKFVSIQMQYMQEKGLTEEEAYNAADRDLHVPRSEDDQAENLYGALADPAIDDETARLYLASVKDSRRDQKLYRALVQQSKSTE